MLRPWTSRGCGQAVTWVELSGLGCGTRCPRKAHPAGAGVEEMQKTRGLPSHPAEARAGGVTPGPILDPKGQSRAEAGRMSQGALQEMISRLGGWV